MLCWETQWTKGQQGHTVYEMSVRVSALGCTELIFIDPGVKINGAYYRDVLLSQHLLPQIREISGEFFTFQQDSAPAHRARKTVVLLQRSTPDFISPLLWPPNSPDLNPVDYKIWSILQEWVYRDQMWDVSHLTEGLAEEWSQFDQSIVDCALKEWQVRLKACVNAVGGHFKHMLQQLQLLQQATLFRATNQIKQRDSVAISSSVFNNV